MRVRIKHNFKFEARQIEKFKRDLKKKAFTGLDKPISKSVKNLKRDLRQKIREIKATSETSKKSIKPEIPKFKKDLMRQIFNKNYDELQILKRPNKSIFPVKFGSGFYVTLDGRFEVRMRYKPGWTAEDYKKKVKESFKDAIIIDPKTGKAYQLAPDFITGMKLKCSHGKKTDEDRLTQLESKDAKEVVVTAFKSNFQQALKRAIPIEPVLESVLEGKEEQAKDILRKYNKAEPVKKAIEKIEEIQKNDLKGASEDVVALNNIIKLVNNLKVQKIVKKNNKIEYTLVSTFTKDGDKFEQLLDQLTAQTGVWLLDLQDKLVKNLIKQIEDIINEYGRAK